MDKDRIKCGRCASEYFPRMNETNSKLSINAQYDYSCPVCKFDGRVQEGAQKAKKILLDHIERKAG